MFKLIADFKPHGHQPEAIRQLVNGLKNNYQDQTLLGVTGSGKTFTIANVIQKTNLPTIIIAHNKTLAAQLYREMKSFFPENAVEYFVSYYDYYQPEAYVPTSDTYIEKDASINEHIERMRLSATKSLLERPDTIIVSSVSAIYGLGDPEAYLSMVLHINVGDKINRHSILRKLASMQYTRNDVDFQRGNYRVRGEVIDVFLAESDEDAIRIEMFDDEIESIRAFDPLTGKVKSKIPRITIYPKTHYATPRETVLKVLDSIKEELKERVSYLEKNSKLLEAQRLSERTRYDIEMLLELGYCSGIENYSRYLSGREEGEAPPTLMDYLPKESLIIIDESHVTIPQIGAMYKGDRARKENLVTYGFRLPSALDNRPLKFEEFETLKPKTIYVSATPSDYELKKSSQIIEQLVRPTGLLDPEIEIRPASSQVDDVLSEINKRVKNSEKVLITTLTKKMSENLTNYLLDHNVKVKYLHSDIDTIERVEIIHELRKGIIDVIVGINLLREGLDIPEVSLVAIFDADKEGFLRSERSLIQTIGRAARNINGKAILYADNITKSMQAAIDETNRRKSIQLEFNEKHNIIPTSISKPVTDILDIEKEDLSKEEKDVIDNYKHLEKKTLSKKIKELEDKMYHHASSLEFEQAAKLRDEVNILKNILLEK